MRIAAIISIFALVVFGALALAQVWVGLFSGEVFFKISVTFGIVIGVLVVSALIRREYVTDERHRKDGFID
ncbi:MAG: hypothetical protein RLZZ244_1295 [Verrucomicrobiota bacterium]|jgi:hypothetical protein